MSSRERQEVKCSLVAVLNKVRTSDPQGYERIMEGMIEEVENVGTWTWANVSLPFPFPSYRVKLGCLNRVFQRRLSRDGVERVSTMETIIRQLATTSSVRALERETDCHMDDECTIQDDWDLVQQQAQQSMQTINAGSYYACYHGHPVNQLVRVRQALVEGGCRRFVFLLGDSTLDNKHWLFDLTRSKESQMQDESITAECVNGLENLLSPPRMVQDVSYWLNVELEQRAEQSTRVLMTAVEESAVADREHRLLAQDAFVRDHIRSDDILVVSMGGNDIAVRPTLSTILNMLLLTRSPDWMIRRRIAPGFGYLVDLFGAKVLDVISRVTTKTKPHMILLCIIYYLDETPGGSWADKVLSKLGYDARPAKLQLILRCVYEAVRAGCRSAGEDVHVFPLFSVLDGKTSADYVQRVEPSVSGGQKLAKALAEVIVADGDAEKAIDSLLQRFDAR